MWVLVILEWNAGVYYINNDRTVVTRYRSFLTGGFNPETSYAYTQHPEYTDISTNIH